AGRITDKLPSTVPKAVANCPYAHRWRGALAGAGANIWRSPAVHLVGRRASPLQQISATSVGSAAPLPKSARATPLRCSAKETHLHAGIAPRSQGARASDGGVTAMIQFTCANCKLLLSHTTAGDKVLCPRCGQKLLVPSPPPPLNKTVLASWEPPARAEGPG